MRKCGCVRSEGNRRASRRQPKLRCVVAFNEQSEKGSSEKRRPSRTGSLRHDCAYKEWRCRERTAPVPTTTSSRANGTACVAERMRIKKRLHFLICCWCQPLTTNSPASGHAALVGFSSLVTVWPICKELPVAEVDGLLSLPSAVEGSEFEPVAKRLENLGSKLLALDWMTKARSPPVNSIKSAGARRGRVRKTTERGPVCQQGVGGAPRARQSAGRSASSPDDDVRTAGKRWP